MTFQIKHTKPSLFSRTFFKVTIALLVFFMLVIATNIFSGPQSLLANFFSPFLKAGDYFYKSFNQIPKFFVDKIKIIEQNTTLLNEIENNRLDLIDYESLKYENKRLKEELQLKPTGNFIATSIIGRSPQIPLDSLFLDKGTSDGLNNEDFILASEKILIGRIVKVSNNRATAALNSATGFISYGYVARTNEPLEIKGDGGGGMEVKVSIDFDITVGDKIMVGNSPAYFIAVVGSTEEDRSSGFKKVLMSLPVDIAKIGVVFVAPLSSE